MQKLQTFDTQIQETIQLLGSHLFRILSADISASPLLEEKLLNIYREILLKGEKTVLSTGKITDYAATDIC